jgi:hypothetical protein
MRSRANAVSAYTTLICASVLVPACGEYNTLPKPQVFVPATYVATLNGANVRPNPTTTSATGTAKIVTTASGFSYTITYTGLATTPSGAQIFGPADAASTGDLVVPIFTTGAIAGTGTLTGTFASTFSTPSRPGITLDSLEVLMRTGKAYVQLFSTVNGDIRGQLSKAP